MAREIAPGGHQNGGGCFPRSEGSETFLFLPSKQLGEVICMYVTLAELLMIITLLIAFAELLLKHFNNNDKK